MTGKKLYPAYNGFNHGGKQKPLCKEDTNILKSILVLTSFLIPGMGLAADGCMSKIVAAISSLGNAVKVIRKHCERIQCPNCSQWWISKRAFKLAVLVESYALYTKTRPAGVVASIHPDAVKSWTWTDYGKFIRKCYARMFKLGVTGGVRVFHPFRVKDDVKHDLRVLGAKDSGGFWKMIRENVLKLPSWYSYVYLAPHIHSIVFPSFIDENTKTDIIVKKYAVFDSVNDTVAHLRYLLSHCGLLTDGEIEPASPFGVLHGWKPEDHLTHEQILIVKRAVADAMGLQYDEAADDVKPVDIEEEQKYDWVAIHEFADYSNEQQQFIGAFVSGITNKVHRSFVDGIISLYNERRNDTDLTKDKRHVFIDDLVDIPEGFEIVIVDR